MLHTGCDGFRGFTCSLRSSGEFWIGKRKDRHIHTIQHLAKPSVIAVVSVCELFLRTAEGVLAPALGGRHTLQTYFLPEQPAVNLAAMDLVFCDSIARRRVQASNLAEYRVVSPETLDMVSAALRS